MKPSIDKEVEKLYKDQIKNYGVVTLRNYEITAEKVKSETKDENGETKETEAVTKETLAAAKAKAAPVAKKTNVGKKM